MVGNNNAIITMADAEVTASLQHFLDSVGYVGTANFDMMVDRRDGSTKLLEVNLRQGATSFYTMAAGTNLVRHIVDDVVYGLDEPLEVSGEERLWLNLPYPAVLASVPASMRAATRAAARRGTSHTLRYRPDLSLRRLLDIARIDARHTLDYVRYRTAHLNR